MHHFSCSYQTQKKHVTHFFPETKISFPSGACGAGRRVGVGL
jgi:hypothetical protein